MELKTQVTQKMALSAHMQQCLEILAMDNMQLGEYLLEQSMENPIIELTDTAVWAEYSPIVLHVENACGEGQESGREPAALEQPNRELYFQLSEYHLPEAVRKAAEYIIESLDERGYFTDNTEESAELLKLESRTVKEALEIVKKLEPRGVGARDLKECLLMQLDEEYPGEETAKEILTGYLDDFSKGRYEKISRETGRTQAQVLRAGEIIRRLNPKPLGSGKASVRTGYLSADIALVQYGEYYDIVLNQTYLPGLQLSRPYIELLGGDADERTKQYIRERYEKARWLQSCVKKRQETLLKITALIFKNQKGFLLDGPSGIRPLTLKKIAEELKMNVSTVSRAVKGKYVQTRWGIYPLRYFFGGGVRMEEGTVSAAQIRAVIKKMIAKEDKRHPLSDSRIEKMLKERGVFISRRTIASYRERLGIPASSVRKAEYLYKADGPRPENGRGAWNAAKPHQKGEGE